MNQERRNQIADMITQNRTVKNAELMSRFGISIETVRRDLEYLEQQGVLRRVYGGAVLNHPLSSEPAYASRSSLHFEQKQAIAMEAAKLVAPNDVIYLGVGTTVQAMTPFLKGKTGLTVFTNALRTAIELMEAPGTNVILPGGQLRPLELTLSGFPAEENLRHFNVSKAFIGIGGITPEGVTDYHLGEAQLHHQIIHQANEAIVLADSSKIGEKAMINVCTSAEITTVITDSHAPRAFISAMTDAGIRVIVAGEKTRK